jgi:hypothetical protein
MQNTETTNYMQWQIGALLVSGATMLHVFSSHTPHQVQATVHASPDTHNTLEREREVHPSHGNHGVRARYATNTGA